MSGSATVGWREWVWLPELGDVPVKAKVDTGALTSALHADDVRLEEHGGVAVARFVVRPHQDRDDGVEVTAPLVDEREVRSSSGEVEQRPTVRTTVQLGATRFTTEVTLTGRPAMGFRMLLGRRALRGRWLVDPGASFIGAGGSTDEPPARDGTDA